MNGLGDVVALAQLTADIAQRLDAARHAPDDVKRLIEEVHRYHRCIARAGNSIRQNGAVLKPLDGVKGDILWFLRRCEQTTKKLQNIVSRYEDIVRGDGPATNEDGARKQWTKALSTMYRSIKWTSKAETVDELRAELTQHTQFLTFLSQQLLSEQMAELSESLQMKFDQIRRGMSSSASSPTLSPLIRPYSISPQFGPSDRSPDPNTRHANREATGSLSTSPRDPPGTLQSGPTMAPLMLPPPADVDITRYVFRHDDSQFKLPSDIPKATRTPGDEFRYVGLASDDEQQELIDELATKTTFPEFPIETVTFVFQKTSSSERATIRASNAGKVMLVQKGSAVEDIWTLNDEKTIRFRQRVPTWDNIIPYSTNGEELTAVVEQGSGLTFVTFEEGRRYQHPEIRTSWVTYKFRNADDCRRFQEALYGYELLLLVPVLEIYRPRTGRGGDRITNIQNIRVWKRGSESRFMVKLIPEPGKRRKKYLEFNLGQEGIKVEAKGKGSESKLIFSGIGVWIDEESFWERRGSMTSLSSASTTGSSISSITRRLSFELSPLVEEIVVVFQAQEPDGLYLT
ncbi:uncharacterized protein Z518_06673 [Rhinocladiella mackenziei CBS 650.93]|uniref:Uncharacterized protein n=1 Tax=Rhinocladiella mackenziei CBS 650.93 TaxID=1442369 RepID=A0A0D2GY35_9EURO|nr:uncharacterized protein Z518_06673 [Rhinocladiella mackenziei CBS 650.93]KIX03123.1 hypothetical protein Z518_06673 [Rhinocladiella mackenziei CBS 650.93]